MKRIAIALALTLAACVPTPSPDEVREDTSIIEVGDALVCVALYQYGEAIGISCVNR